MDIFNFAKKTFAPCTVEQINQIETELGFAFPSWYVNFLSISNGAHFEYGSVGEGFLPFLGFSSLEEALSSFEEVKGLGIFPFGSCDGQAITGFEIDTNNIFYVSIELYEKHFLSDSIEGFLQVYERESFIYNLQVKAELGEITLEEYHRQLASRKP